MDHSKTATETIAAYLADWKTVTVLDEHSFTRNRESFGDLTWTAVSRSLAGMLGAGQVYRVADGEGDAVGRWQYGLTSAGRERYGHPSDVRFAWDPDFERAPAGPDPAPDPEPVADVPAVAPATGAAAEQGEPVPDTIDALAAYIAGCEGPGEGPALVRMFDRLVEARGTEAANAMWEAALSAIAHEQAIAYSRAQLIESLGNAVWNTGQAAGHLDRLCAPAGWDVDYAEGTRGADIAAFLEDAGRQLRAALALARTV